MTAPTENQDDELINLIARCALRDQAADLDGQYRALSGAG
jgi:hypothetical protein